MCNDTIVMQNNYALLPLMHRTTFAQYNMVDKTPKYPFFLFAN